MSAITSKPSEADWLAYKDFIQYEYLVKDTSLKDLVILSRAQGLYTTKGHLETKLKRWNFSKNLDKKTWQYVDRKIRKRRHEGKDSDVIHCGRRLKKLKVTKETNRHRETNIMARFKTPPPSPMDPQLSICTPPTFQMSFEWPSDLPWLRLRETSWNSISNVMPEWYPGEHTKTAQNLFARPTAESFSEYFKVMVYMLSNSMVHDHRQLDFYTSLMRIGIIDLRADLKKLRNESSTFRAFIEMLFQFEIREATSRSKHNTERPRPLHLITWLLELGQDPNCHCQVFLYNTLFLATPIQHATYAGYLELIELLLRFRARAEVPQCRTHEGAFVNLALGSGCSDVRKLRVLNLLFDHKFLSRDEMLRAAIELRDEALICKMLQCGADATSYETSWLPPEHRNDRNILERHTHFANPSALMMAFQAGGRMADLMLDYLRLKDQPAPSILADACIAAAYGGHYDIVLRLDEMYSSGKACNASGITPLEAAVVGGDSTVCRYLLGRYGGASSSLALVAALLAKVDVLQLLIDYGANHNARPCLHGNALYIYLNIPHIYYYPRRPSTILTMLIVSATEFNSREQSVIKMIQNKAILSSKDVAGLSSRCLHKGLKEAISAGGDPNDEDGYGRTALRCAMNCHYPDNQKGRTDSSVFFDEEDQTDGCLPFDYEDTRVARRLTVELLIQAGAQMTGGEVVRAICLRDQPLLLFLLQHGGTLTDIDNTGRGCLEAEIEARNDPSLQEALEMQEFAIDAGPFCAAIQRQNWALVERLFERAHQPTSCHLLEGTAVGLAAKSGQLTIMEKFLTRFSRHSVLTSAILPVRFGLDNIEVYNEHCNRAGFWRTPPNEEGEHIHIEGSLLTLAALGQDTSGFRELLRRGCCMDTIAWSIVAESEKSSDYLHLLREFGTGFGTSTKHDIELKTALCKSIDKGNHDVTRYLVEVGADVNEFDIHASKFNTAKQLSPLQLAAKKNDIDMALYLLEKGAKVNAPPAFYQGATALQFASIGGCLGFTRHLLQLGARVNVRGSARLGRSALEGAAEHGRLDTLALLVHHGAVTTGRGRQQLINSVAYAQVRAHNTAAEWLKDNCGWTVADQDLLELDNVHGRYFLGTCLRSYCCDEYHVSQGECVYHYTEEQRNVHYEQCEVCERWRYDRGDGRERNFSSEDEDMDLEGDED
ncbi:hypothetical protein ACKRZS_001992 [Fusarium odoratissimum]